MARLNLHAENQAHELILAYLEENASEALAEKINEGTRTLSSCFDFIKNEARKRAVNGCAAVEDSTVYGWAVHYFEETEIEPEEEKPKKEEKPKVVTIPKPQEKKPEQKPKKTEKAEKADQITGQTSIFDFI